MNIRARLNRLGMWNRLAVVLALIVCVVVPIRWYVQQGEQLSADLQRINEWCGTTEGAKGIIDTTTLKHRSCNDVRDTVARQGRAKMEEDFWIVLSMTIVACLVVYASIWSAVQTVKWVVAGRNPGKGAG